MQQVAGLLITIYCKFTEECSYNFFFAKSVKIRQNYGHKFVASRFLAHPVCQLENTTKTCGQRH